MTNRPAEFEGIIRIEWRPSGPASPEVMPGWLFRIFANDGQPILNVTELTLHVPADHQVWAECVMFADPAGRPAGGEQLYLDDDKNILTGTFAFEVADMSVVA